ERRYIAEPKLDGQRAQVHISNGRTVACYSRPGRDLLRHPGMAWLQALSWPVDAAVLDGEACAGDGHEGIQAVFEERNRDGGDMSFLAFDLLTLDDHALPWRRGSNEKGGRLKTADRITSLFAKDLPIQIPTWLLHRGREPVKLSNK